MEKFSDLKGRIIHDIRIGPYTVEFTLDKGERLHLYHSQDCCEVVTVQSVIGEVASVLGKVLEATEETFSDHDPEGYVNTDSYRDSYTWSIFKLKTTYGGSLEIRFLGESNGYYSEGVDWARL
jgi:hypothetical protein